MRAFVAAEIDEHTRARLARVQSGLVGRRVAPENLHLTLAFLDDQSEDVLEALHEELLCLRAPPMTVQMTGLGSFGGDKPRLLFADVAPTPTLTQLRTDVRAAARRAGILLRRERFHPHITLTRPGRDDGLLVHRALSEQGPMGAAVQIESIGLFESVLSPGGARYFPLATYDLSATGLSG